MPFSDSRMEDFLRASRQASVTLDLRELLHAMLNAAIDLTSSETASILEYDAAGQALRFSALPRQHRKRLEGILVPLTGSVAGLALRDRQPVAVHDAAHSPQHFKGTDELSGYVTRSVLAVPLILGDRPLGVLEVVNKRGGLNYSDEDATLLESLAAQVALAIENNALRLRLETVVEDAARLDKMKGDFIAITSHELRTPLGLILGHSTFLREIVGPEYREQLDTIIRSATRLKEIIENMTSVENAHNGTAIVQRQLVSVRKIIQEQIQIIRPEFDSKKIKFHADLGQDDLMLEGDTEKIGIILSSLLKNSVTFTNPDGHVFLAAEKIPGYVKISLVDDGIGIPAKDLPHIFERFYQVESHLTRKHGGMGLGLSVAKMLTEIHGGRVLVESVEGKGSKFTVLLPLDSRQAQAAGKVFVD